MPRRPRVLTVDLHGHDVLTALELAVTRVSEAHRNGYEQVEFVHGAADVEQAVESGRGRIKWELRQLSRTGRFAAWTDSDRTWEKAGSLLLYLKPNGRQQRENWSREPGPRYGR